MSAHMEQVEKIQAAYLAEVNEVSRLQKINAEMLETLRVALAYVDEVGRIEWTAVTSREMHDRVSALIEKAEGK